MGKRLFFATFVLVFFQKMCKLCFYSIFFPGWDLFDIDSDLIYQMVDVNALSGILKSKHDVIVFVGV